MHILSGSVTSFAMVLVGLNCFRREAFSLSTSNANRRTGYNFVILHDSLKELRSAYVIVSLYCGYKTVIRDSQSSTDSLGASRPPCRGIPHDIGAR